MLWNVGTAVAGKYLKTGEHHSIRRSMYHAHLTCKWHVEYVVETYTVYDISKQVRIRRTYLEGSGEVPQYRVVYNQQYMGMKCWWRKHTPKQAIDRMIYAAVQRNVVLLAEAYARYDTYTSEQPKKGVLQARVLYTKTGVEEKHFEWLHVTYQHMF